MTGKIILDSSVWISIHRKDLRICNPVLPLIEKRMVAVVDIIVAEVLRGCLTKQSYLQLLNGFTNFDIFTTDWLEVAELGYVVGRAGFNPPLADLYIAQSAIKEKLTVLTHDRHFLQIQEVAPFKCELL